MTEAVSHGQPVAPLGTQIRPAWRNSTSTDLDNQPVIASRRHASLPASVPSVYVTAISMADPNTAKSDTFSRTTEKVDDPRKPRAKKLEDFLPEELNTSGPSSSKVNALAFGAKKNSPGEIKFQNFEDEEDEETSEDYDDEDETEDEDDENKPGVSDTETQNLLDEVEEDGDTDGEDVPDSVDFDGCRKGSEELSGTDSWKKDKVISKRPRRQLVTLDDEALYEMSEQQKEYYTRCFKYLMKLTVGHFDLNGAVHGANEHVVEFFKKSDLDTDTLSKIWALSDVNEDGYLDHAEFSTAMHLIVLNVKGNIAVPDVLPKCIKPPLTPVRHATLQNAGSAGLSNAEGETSVGDSLRAMHKSAVIANDDRQPAAKTPLGWRQFDYDESSGQAVQQQHSLSDDHLHSHFNRMDVVERLSDFSDTPPLLVDGRPTALKATKPLICAIDPNNTIFTVPESGAHLLKNTLSPQAPKGPPPKPPPRPPNRGHGRSASLDLNPLATLSARYVPYNASSSSEKRESTAPIPSTYGHASLTAVTEPLRISAVSATQQGSLLTQAPLSSTSARSPVSAPPVPPRTALIDAEVQTENLQRDLSYGETAQAAKEETRLIEFNDNMEKRIKELVELESLATSGNGGAHVNWKERCAQLKRLNAELEHERAKLAQVRLQLEVRLQEISPSSSSTVKPTSL